MSAHDKGLMGTANQLFVQNKVDDAIKVAMEVIRRGSETLIRDFEP